MACYRRTEKKLERGVIARKRNEESDLLLVFIPWEDLMETEYPKILASRECSTMASTWTEYLRLDKKSDHSAVLEICQYEVLGEMQGDEEGNPILPPEIDPKDVVRIEDGYICGGVLTSEYGGESFQFTTESISEAIEWLKDWGKCDTELLAELVKAVGAPTSLIGTKLA
ncbi:hypothetical protein [Bradyrhizobium sp.]|uniref:hypothetical protein n=2 Tax=unclassified Bradyrhizobium TaxID=2631580 RepID=UPI0007C8BF26|nr:hypothetical protein [Bradyrhizobium sp.]